MAEAETHTEEKKLEPTFERTDVAPCRIQLKVQVAAERVTEILEEKFREINEGVSVPGFRRGKAPRPLLERKFGKTIRDELKGELLEKSFHEALEKAELEPVGHPDIKEESVRFADNEPFAYEATFEIMPKIDVKDYFGMEADRRKVEVTDKDVEEAIGHLRDHKAEWTPVADDEKSADGDQLIADFTLTLGDKEIDRSENTTLAVAPGISIYGVEVKDLHEKLRGKKAGQKIKAAFEIPKEHPHKELAGRKVDLAGTIKSIKRKILPELDEAFLKALDMDDVAELRDETARKLKRGREAEEDERLKDEILQKIVDRHDFPIPDALANHAETEAVDRFRANLYMQGVAEEEIAKAVEGKRAELRQMGVKALKAVLVVDRIAEQERIFATEDMVDERLSRIAQQYGRWPHEMRQQFEEQGMMKSLRREIRADLVRDEILKKAKVKEAGA